MHDAQVSASDTPTPALHAAVPAGSTANGVTSLASASAGLPVFTVSVGAG